MPAAWPASLPQKVNSDGYVEQRQPSIVRSSVEVGPPKVRRRYTSDIVTFALNQIMTRTQITTLETFFVTTLLAGSLSFDWLHPRTEVAASFRFIDAPTWSPLGDIYYAVTLNLELLP